MSMSTLGIKLDVDQVTAINRIATCKGVVSAAGCAGCGKSTMLACLLELLYENTSSNVRILVVSETNAAIDENLQKIIERKKLGPKHVLRLGSVSTDVSKDLKNYYVEEIA